MRAICRQVRELNTGKRETLTALVHAYAAEKRHWLDVFARQDTRPLIKHHRQVRDAAVAGGYASKAGLQARMWKLALVDAAETWDKYWQALFVEIRRKLAGRKDFDEARRHYAFWLMAGYAQFFDCLDDSVPAPPFKYEPTLLPYIAGYVRRTASRLRGRPPTVKTTRSVVLDANCYSVFERCDAQHLKIMTRACGQRLVLPLLGTTTITGTIRVVLGHGGPEVHVFQDLKKKLALDGPIEAVDFGYTEAMTDTSGRRYGTNLGAIITAASEARHRTGRARNRLRARAERYAAGRGAKLQRKARNLRRFNLGQQKWQAQETRTYDGIRCEINRGLNAALREKRPAVLVTEDLRHAFTFDKPKAWNRRLSAWTKGVLQDRVAFKALAEGFRHEQVNPAYGSQTCPWCGFVEKHNRSGDRFLCLHCRQEGHADRVAALNYLGRWGDREIARYTPYRDVKTILLERFHRRLEAQGQRLRDCSGQDFRYRTGCATAAGETYVTAGRRKPLEPGGHSKSETQPRHHER